VVDAKDGTVINHILCSAQNMPFSTIKVSAFNRNIFVLGKSYITEYSIDCKFVREFGINGVKSGPPGHFKFAKDITISGIDGTIYVYVALYKFTRIHMYNANGVFTKHFDCKEQHYVQLNSPHFIAIKDSNVYVYGSHKDNLIQIYNPNGDIFGFVNCEKTKFQAPRKIVFCGDNVMVVTSEEGIMMICEDYEECINNNICAVTSSSFNTKNEILIYDSECVTILKLLNTTDDHQKDIVNLNMNKPDNIINVITEELQKGFQKELQEPQEEFQEELQEEFQEDVTKNAITFFDEDDDIEFVNMEEDEFIFIPNLIIQNKHFMI